MRGRAGILARVIRILGFYPLLPQRCPPAQGCLCLHPDKAALRISVTQVNNLKVPVHSEILVPFFPFRPLLSQNIISVLPFIVLPARWQIYHAVNVLIACGQCGLAACLPSTQGMELSSAFHWVLFLDIRQKPTVYESPCPQRHTREFFCSVHCHREAPLKWGAFWGPHRFTEASVGLMLRSHKENILYRVHLPAYISAKTESRG